MAIISGLEYSYSHAHANSDGEYTPYDLELIYTHNDGHEVPVIFTAGIFTFSNQDRALELSAELDFTHDFGFDDLCEPEREVCAAPTGVISDDWQERPISKRPNKAFTSDAEDLVQNNGAQFTPKYGSKRDLLAKYSPCVDTPMSKNTESPAYQHSFIYEHEKNLDTENECAKEHPYASLFYCTILLFYALNYFTVFNRNGSLGHFINFVISLYLGRKLQLYRLRISTTKSYIPAKKITVLAGRFYVACYLVPYVFYFVHAVANIIGPILTSILIMGLVVSTFIAACVNVFRLANTFTDSIFPGENEVQNMLRIKGKELSLALDHEI